MKWCGVVWCGMVWYRVLWRLDSAQLNCFANSLTRPAIPQVSTFLIWIANAVSAKVALGLEKPTAQKNQVVPNVLSYFTGMDWAVFADPALHAQQKVGRITERFKLLGGC